MSDGVVEPIAVPSAMVNTDECVMSTHLQSPSDIDKSSNSSDIDVVQRLILSKYSISYLVRLLYSESYRALYPVVKNESSGESVFDVNLKRSHPFSCNICEFVLIEPVSLPCGHSYCKKCIVDWKSNFCKLCRKVFSGNYSDIRCNVLVNGLVNKWWQDEVQATLTRDKTDVLVSSGQLEEALHCYSQILSKVGHDHITLCSRSDLYMKMGQAEKALQDADHAAFYQPFWSKAHLHRSLALQSLNRGREALVALLIGALLDDNSPLYLIDLERQLRQQLVAAAAATAGGGRDCDGDATCRIGVDGAAAAAATTTTAATTVTSATNDADAAADDDDNDDDELVAVAADVDGDLSLGAAERFRPLAGQRASSSPSCCCCSAPSSPVAGERSVFGAACVPLSQRLSRPRASVPLAAGSLTSSAATAAADRVDTDPGQQQQPSADHCSPSSPPPPPPYPPGLAHSANSFAADVACSGTTGAAATGAKSHSNVSHILSQFLRQLSGRRQMDPIYSDCLHSLFDACIAEINRLRDREGEQYCRAVSRSTGGAASGATAGVSVDELECSLCCRLLWQPATTRCGHTFCRPCLSRWLDHRAVCPLCQTQLPSLAASSDGCSTLFVQHAIGTCLPEALAERKRVHCAEILTGAAVVSGGGGFGAADQLETPVFVCTLALPQLACPLHVFEPRYRLMVRRCLESGRRQFAMCLPSEQPHSHGFVDVGVMLQLRDVRFLNDGRSVLDCVGGRRFRCLAKGQCDGYSTATVQLLSDQLPGPEQLPPLQQLHDQVRRLVEGWWRCMQLAATNSGQLCQRVVSCYGAMPAVQPAYWLEADGPAWLWWTLAIMPVSPTVQLDVLAMPSLERRLLAVRAMLMRLKRDAHGTA